MKIKALTVHEPYASLIGAGKDFETRGWATRYTGPIAIHAGQSLEALRPFLHNFWYLYSFKREAYQNSRGTFTYEAAEALRRVFLHHAKLQDFTRGAVIAVGELVACHRCEDLQLSPREKLFGLHEPGRYAWEIRNVKRLQQPVIVRGQQGLWDWDLPEDVRYV